MPYRKEPPVRPTNLRWTIPPLLLAAPLLARPGVPPEARDWVEPMRQVHARFNGRKGTFAQFGDSITVTAAFWAPLPQARKNAPAEMERAFQAVKAAMRPECWSEWKGPRFGSEGGQTVRWASEHLDEWLQR